MKKLLSVLLITLFIMTMFAGCTDKTDETDNTTTALVENPASDFEFEINADNTGVNITKYIGTATDVVVPSKINNLPVDILIGYIGDSSSNRIGVFEGSGVKTVVLPKTLTIIGYSAFRNCTELTKVTAPADSSLTRITPYAFNGCVKLETADFSTTKLVQIEECAFAGCTALKEIKLPDTVEKIDNRAFCECSALTEFDLPDSLTELGYGAFFSCTALKSIVVPVGLNLIYVTREPAIYTVPALEKIVFDEGRTEISGYAFLQTNESVEITVPKSVKKFSPQPFLINSETEIKLIFLGDAPEIIDDQDPDWFGKPTIYYDPTTDGWDSFVWKDKYTLVPIQ